MGRTANPTIAPVEATAPAEVLQRHADNAEQLAVLHAQAQAAANDLAREIGYSGTLTVGALEDEIRFYQRRSVEALLECGKRLLLLKELTPHGEFMGRVDLLGFSRSTAQRFMQAAKKASKLPTVGNLATQMQSAKAFLELITHDDDVIEKAVGELDAIDRMSASELRARLRDVEADLHAAGERIQAKNARIDQLEGARQRIATLPPQRQLAQLQEEATRIMRDAAVRIKGELRQALVKLAAEDATGGDPRGQEVFMAGLVGQLAFECTRLREEFTLPDVSNATDLELMQEVAQWSQPIAAPAADGAAAAAPAQPAPTH